MGFTQANQLPTTDCDFRPPTSDCHGGSAVQGPTPQSKTYFSRSLVPTKLPFEYVNCGGGAPICSEAVQWVCWLWDLLGGANQGQPPPVFCPGATWHKLQSDLQMAICTGLGGAQARPTCEPNVAAASAKLGAT